MANPGEGQERGIEVNSDRRNFMTVAVSAGIAGAAGFATDAAQAQQAGVLDPQKPAGLGPKAMLDSRFPITFESSVPESIKVVTQYMAALSRRDLEGLSKVFQYPFVTYEGIDTVIVNSPAELQAKPPASLNTTGNGAHKIRPRSYDILDKVEVLFYTPCGAGIALNFSRFRADGTKLLACYGIYGVTNNDGKWGIEYMSTIFRPAEQLHLDYDAKEAAERGIHDSYRDHNLGRKYNGLNPNYTERPIENPGEWGGVNIGAISYPKEQPEGWQMGFYKIKGVKSRLKVTTREVVGAPARADASSDALFRAVSGAGVGTWFQSLEWADTRVLSADMEKAHAISGNQRFTEQGDLISQSQYMVTLLYRNGVWTASDGPSIFGRQMYQDRSSDVMPAGI